MSTYKTLDKTSPTNVTVNLQRNAESAITSTAKAKVIQGQTFLGSQAADPDLQRAIDLINLHYGLKEKHTHGVNKELEQARIDVDRVLESMRARDSGTA